MTKKRKNQADKQWKKNTSTESVRRNQIKNK